MRINPHSKPLGSLCRLSFSVFFAAILANPALADECAQIKEALGYAANSFEAIKGAELPLERWAIALKVDNYTTCYLERVDQVVLSCETKRFANRNQAQSIFNARSNAAKACLGPDWQLASLGQDRFGISNLGSRQVVMMTIFSDGVASNFFVKTWMYQMPARGSAAPEEAPTVSAAIPREFCPDLKRVISTAPQKFEPILGRKRSGDWTASVQLTGWFSCDVSELREGDPKTRYYTCELSPFVGQEDVAKGLDAVGSVVKSCLGNTWTPVRSSTRDNRPQLQFEAGQQDPIVELRVRYSTARKRWGLHLDVNLPE